MAEKLFTAGHLGDIPIRNRVVMAPLTRMRANDAGVPSDLAPTYYAQRASAGLIIAEATQICELGKVIRLPPVFTLQNR